MVQGTMSNVGKSVIAAGLCRIFHQDGYKVAPFKSQNMALNSYVTKDGLEMGRAQVMQAEAAGVEPSVQMNPILLKPTSDVGSQVIINGVSIGNLSAREYFKRKKEFLPDIEKAMKKLEEEYDIIVIEGAGSPAEINLKADDIVNMGLAKLLHAPVLLVGDIDRGGVFAQLYGTTELLEADEKALIKGLIINKFRGDKSILDPGIVMIEEKCKIPVVGVTPYMYLDLEDEDSLSERFEKDMAPARIDLAVIRLPHISNFTDFNIFETIPEVSVRYIDSVSKLGLPDLIFLPGTKNTLDDLIWLRESGLEAALKKYVAREGILFGICGGYQMLGTKVTDVVNAEGNQMHTIAGLEFLEGETTFELEKVLTQVTGEVGKLSGPLTDLSGLSYEGYEIHMGRTDSIKEQRAIVQGERYQNVYGTYIHGIFDAEGMASAVVDGIAKRKGISLSDQPRMSYQDYKEIQYDKLADGLRASIDMDVIYQILNEQG